VAARTAGQVLLALVQLTRDMLAARAPITKFLLRDSALTHPVLPTQLPVRFISSATFALRSTCNPRSRESTVVAACGGRAGLAHRRQRGPRDCITGRGVALLCTLQWRRVLRR
jgi:hypothetical protein